MVYFRKSTSNSPAVIMDTKTKSVLISGRATCRNSNTYTSTLSEIKQNLLDYEFNYLNIKLKPFNILAAKNLIVLLKYIKQSPKIMITRVHWYYNPEDHEMKDMAEDYSQLIEMKIDIFMD